MKRFAVAALLAAGCTAQPNHTAEQLEYAVRMEDGTLLVPGEEQLAHTMFKATVVTLDCDAHKNAGLINGVIRNDGRAVIRGATVFIEVDGKTSSTPVLVHDLPVGSLGNFTLPIGEAKRPDQCRVVAAQNRDGRSLL